MKHYILAMVILIPCVLIFNDNENIYINILGIVYIFLLYILSKTRKGKDFCKKVETENEKLLTLIFKK